MSEHREKLRAMLAELEAELNEVDTLDPASRAKLEEVANDISAALWRTDPKQQPASSNAPHSLQERLAESVEQFRAQHPTLAGIAERLIDGLAQLGI